MSVINNANPGSHIAALIFIDRVLNRHQKKKTEGYVSIDSFLKDNRPEYLFIDEKRDDDGNFKLKKNPEPKLRETLLFWTNQGLWDSTEHGFRAKSELCTDDNLRERILATIFSKKHDLSTGTGIEPLIRGIGLFLALNQYTFAGNHFFRSPDINDIAGKYFPDKAEDGTRLTINDSETATFANYGILLGYFEKIAKDKFVVDPTGILRIYLTRIFKLNEEETTELEISEFVKRLSALIPVFDNGIYRKQIEKMIASKASDWIATPPHTLSGSLSHALYRLNIEGHIYLDSKSDFEGSMSLQLPNNELKIVSHIRLAE